MPAHRLSLLCFLLSTQILMGQVVLKPNNFTNRFTTLIQTKNSTDSLQLVISVKDVTAFNNAYKGTILGKHDASKTFLIKITAKDAQQLLQDENVLFADVYRKPREELTTGSLDLSVNNISFMHHRYPAYKGQGIKASVKEQQFDSTDIDFWGRYFNSGVASATSSTHASIMATMLGGGGNTSQKATGAAPGVLLTGSSFFTLLPDTDESYRQHNISLQNHSYGTDIENYYGADARAYDINVLNNPSLVHVFSTGNKGTATSADGIYKGIEGFVNLTGSFKMAKNIITVGAVDSFSNVVALSSKGPAYDGRVKPEIVAYGLDGSSGAAALVSGVVAVLQQAYLSLENKLPTAALIKAVLVNSADDKGTAQVDFSNGFGNLNAYNALTNILQKRYWQDSVGKREIRRLTITVPQNISNLKVTIAWSDVAADANAAKALMNDLNATLHLGGQTWQPWILDHAADKSALQQPAIRGKDTLNNIEQITIDNPLAGDYELVIDGASIQTSGQAFAVAYQFDTARTFTFIYPTVRDAITSGSSQIIKWQTTFHESAVLEYTTNGTDWQTIKEGVEVQKKNETFLVPDITGKVVFRARLNSDNFIFYSDTIVVAPEIRMNVGLNCADSVMLFWNSVANAEYQLYTLGDKYMEPVNVVKDTFVVFNKAVQPNFYFAVAPRISGQPGTRSMTMNYTLQGVGCYLYTFYAFKHEDNVQLNLQLGTLYNIAKIEYQVLNSQKGFETFFTDTAPVNTTLQATHMAPKTGVNLYRAVITTVNSAVVYSGTETIYHFNNQPIIVYPNPARQSEAVRILAQDIDIYSIQVVDANGRTVYTKMLEDYNQSIPPLRLSKGVYFIRIWSDEKSYQTQKLIVY